MDISTAIGKNLIAAAAGRIARALGPILLAPAMIHAWGIDVYGEWLILTAVPSYLLLTPDFGLGNAVTNRMAFLTAKGEVDHAVLLFRSAWILLLVFAASFLGIAYAFTHLFDWRTLGLVTLGRSQAVAIVVWTCAQVLVSQQVNLLAGVYTCARRNARATAITSAGSFLILAASLVVAYTDGGPVMFAAIGTVCNVLMYVAMHIDARRLMPQFSLSITNVSLASLRPYLIPGLGHAGMPLFNALQNQGVLIVLGMLAGPTSVAIFQTIRVLSNGVKTILGLPVAAIKMELAALLGENRTATIRTLLIRNSQFGAVTVLVFISVLAIAGADIYRLWLGGAADYEPLTALIMLAGLLPFVFGQSFYMLIAANNQVQNALVPLLGVAVLSLGLVAVGCQLFGTVGTALAVFVWEVGVAVVCSVVATKTFELDVGAFWRECAQLNTFVYEMTSRIKAMLARRRKASPHL